MRTVRSGSRTLDDIVAQFPGATSVQRSYLSDLLAMADDAAAALGISAYYVTSWLRSGSGVHPIGAAIDFAGPTREATADLFIWLARNRLIHIGEIILEPPNPPDGQTGHVHVTLSPHGGRGQVLLEREGGGYLELDPFHLGLFRGVGQLGQSD